MEPSSAVRPASPAEHEEALRLLFRDLPVQEREQRVSAALGLVRAGELDPNGLFVEVRDRKLAGVLACLPVPGASALFWPPRSVADEDAARREDRLIAAGLAWVRSRGAKLAQALLTPGEVPLAAALQRNGFRHVTRLWYLAADGVLPLPYLSSPARLEFAPFDPSNPAELQQTLLRTYEGTSDCPEINGIRTVEEVISGHRAQGRFDASRWWTAFHAGRAVGVLLMSDMVDRGDWDVSYLGIVRDARRQGFGRELLLKAFNEARAAGVPRVTLSVDARNAAAMQLYRSFGFSPYDCREVYLAIRP